MLVYPKSEQLRPKNLLTGSDGCSSMQAYAIAGYRMTLHMMDELLTAKQVQDLLKVDRTTVYRMLNDGRLIGVRIGQQWRFSRQEIETFLSGLHPQEPTPEKRGRSHPAQVLPIHCVQIIQDVFAEIAGVGAITTATDGEPLTRISNSCRFCDLILASKTGRQACIACWRRLAEQVERPPKFVDCHAGLQYARGRIEVDGRLVAVLIAGQLRIDSPSSSEEAKRIQRLADRHELDPEKLFEAAREIPVLDKFKRVQIGSWLERVSQVLAEVGRERAELIRRLQQIADISHFDQA